MTALSVLLVSSAAPALAQANDTPAQERLQQQRQDQVSDAAMQMDRDQTRDQIRSRIDAASDLSDSERARMRSNLDACLELGVPAGHLGAVFPNERHRMSTAAMMRLQTMVMNAAREGLDVEPVLAKAQEGRTKGVPDPTLERACTRMENDVRAANRVMAGMSTAGLEPPGEQAQNRRMEREVAQHMWRGMDEADYDQLRDRARERRRDGECNAGDVVAAGEVATRLMEANVARDRAVNFAGEALQHGYRSNELRQIQTIIAARYHRGQPMDELLGGMEHCVGTGMGPGEMYSYMIRHGWMGPGDMYGPGGNQPSDHMGHGGSQGGMGGNDDKGHHGGGGNMGG